MEINYKLVGQRMQQLRKANNITQEQIADSLNTTVAFISNIENNRTKINLRVLMYYSKICHVSIDSLLNAGNPRFIKSDENSAVENEILRVLKNYNKNEKIRILKMLKIGKDLDLDA